jgi:hypothetical protein
VKQQPQPFNDGIVSIYSVENNAAAGDAPAEILTPKETLRFHRRTVGIQRQYLAAQAQSRVDFLLRCPYRPEVSVQDVAIPTLDKKQYRITAVQVPENIRPPVMDLTLERLGADYDLS